MKREHGKIAEQIEAATAPATVTGELSFNEPLVARCDWEGESKQRPGSQETCLFRSPMSEHGVCSGAVARSGDIEKCCRMRDVQVRSVHSQLRSSVSACGCR